MTPSELLGSYMDALRPIIFIENSDFTSVDALIEEACKERISINSIDEYNHASGRVHFKTKVHKENGDNYPIPPWGQDSPAGRLSSVLKDYTSDIELDTVLILKDIHEELRDPIILAQLKAIALRTMQVENYKVSVIIVASRLVIPPELEKFITVFDIPLPSQTEIESLLKEYAGYHQFEISAEDIDELSFAFKGLSQFEIIQILNLAYQYSGRVTKANKDLILKEKQNTIRKTGLLEAVNFNKDISDVGGLDNLVSYLKQKASVFTRLSEAVKFGIDIPKGVLIVGMPGCGKSLAAKAAASLFNAPLFRFDVGKMLGKYVGESEANMRQALRIAEASTPCVLWIDEIEKAFAGIGKNEGGGEVTTRLFGYFLTWMQEKESSVYVVATANDISNIPPEFLRKGRFDEMFSVNLPSKEERRSIFEIHLSKRKPNWKDLGIRVGELARLAGNNTEDTFSGADIESVVKTALESAFKENREITQDDLIKAIQDTKPIKTTMPGKIEDLKKILDKYQFQEASSSQQNQKS